MIMIPAPVDNVSPSITLRDIIFLTGRPHPKRAPRPPLVVLPQIYYKLSLLVSRGSTSFPLNTLQFVQLTLQPGMSDVLPHKSAIICGSYSFEGRGPSSFIINVAIRPKTFQPGQPEVGLEGRAAAHLLVEAVLAPR